MTYGPVSDKVLTALATSDAGLTPAQLRARLGYRQGNDAVLNAVQRLRAHGIGIASVREGLTCRYRLNRAGEAARGLLGAAAALGAAIDLVEAVYRTGDVTDEETAGELVVTIGPEVVRALRVLAMRLDRAAYLAEIPEVSS